MNDAGTIKQVLHDAFSRAAVEVYDAQGGYLVSVTWDGFDVEDQGKNQQQVLEVLKQAQSRMKDFVFLHRLFTYRGEDAAYVVPGTLHTVGLTYEGGIPTSTLSAGDAYILLREVDGELLVMGNYRKTTLPARELLNDDGDPVLPFADNDFVELEAQGGNYRVDKAWRDGDRIWVKLP